MKAVALIAGVVAILATACGRRPNQDDGAAAAAAGAPYLDLDDVTPAERAALLAAEPFVLALAACDYGAAYDQLAAPARARMSLNQFAPDEDDAAFARHEQHPEANVTRERFIALLQQRTESKLGRPAAVEQLYAHSSDPATLSGRNNTGVDGFNTLLAIGNIPDSIPAEIRRASLRGRLRVQLDAAQLAAIAAAEEVSVEELKKNPDFEPYLNFKLVMIDDAGALRVGYFEFMPPSMLD